MKTKLFTAIAWLAMILFVTQMSAQADPVFTSLNPSSQMVTITNSGDEMIDIDNYQLCTDGFRYDSVGSLTTDSTMLAPGGTLTLTWDEIPTNGSGVLMLFSSSIFGSSDPDVVRDYVRWGTNSNFRINQGVNSGRWSRATASVSFTCPPSDTSGVITTGGTRGGSPGAWGDADAGIISLDVNATEAEGGATTRIDGEFAASICVDGRPDPIVVNHVTDATRSYLYVITDSDDDETILNITASNAIDLDGAGPGTCLIWGWSYSGLGGQAGALATFGGGPLQALRDADCSDVSQEFITVVREEPDAGTISIDLDATGNPNNTTSFGEDGLSAVICVDGRMDPIVVSHTTTAENLTYLYVITDTDDAETILGITGSPSIDLDEAGIGTCAIWGWSYRGLDQDTFIGGPLQALRDEDCSEISVDFIEVIREEADAGTIGIDLEATGNPNNTTSFGEDGLSAVICVDGRMDPIVVFHETPAENLTYRYVITDTDDAETILGFSASPAIDLDAAGIGTCAIWGWSYRGLDQDTFVGGPLQALRDEDCSDISVDFIEVIREAADAGTIGIDLEATGNPNNTTSFGEDGLSAVICVDGRMDPIVVFHETPAENLTYRYVITDTDDAETILGFSASPAIDLDAAGIGTCAIWGWSYRGLDQDTFIGGPLQALRDEDCSDISVDFIEVIREAADAGTIGIDLEATGNPNNTTSFGEDGLSAVICVDGRMDPIVVFHETPAENLTYRYVITDTDDAETILGFSASPAIDLDAAGIGTCAIWGWSYRGLDQDTFIGGPLQALRDEDCSDISVDFIEVIREAADAGTIGIDLEATGNPNNTTSFGEDGLSAVICVDGRMDPIVVFHETPAENLTYRYVITDTDDAETILGFSASPAIDLDAAGIGTCAIWGWSYRGLDQDTFIGGPLQALRDEDCSDISVDFIEVIREAADAGTIGIDIEATGNPNNTTSISADGLSAVICVDGRMDPIVVFHETPAENLTYRYVITDTDDAETILGFSASPAIDLDGAGVGTCAIWGWSYRGLDQDTFIGGPLQALRDEDCSDISVDFIEVIREEADGGTVFVDLDNTDDANGTTTIDDENNVTIIVGDGIDNPIVVAHENPGAENLSYRYVITDAATGLILNVVATNTINLEGVEPGVCEIWGWSYRGVEGNGLEQVGEPLSALDDLDCSDISDNAVIVTRTEALSVEDDILEMAISVYPNPVVDFVNVRVAQSSQELSVTVYDLTGKRVQVQNGSEGDMRINVSDLTSGIYLLEVVDTANNARAVQRIIKR